MAYSTTVVVIIPLVNSDATAALASLKQIQSIPKDVEIVVLAIFVPVLTRLFTFFLVVNILNHQLPVELYVLDAKGSSTPVASLCVGIKIPMMRITVLTATCVHGRN